MTHFLTGEEVDRLFDAVEEGPHRDFSWALVQHARKTDIARGNGDRFRFIDPLAAAVVIEPGIVTRSRRASVDCQVLPGSSSSCPLLQVGEVRLAMSPRWPLRRQRKTGPADLHS